MEYTVFRDKPHGQARYTVCVYDGAQIFNALNVSESADDVIYVYPISGGYAELVLPETGIHPVSISPSDEFLVFSTGTEMRAYLFSLKALYSVAPGIENEEVFFVGWLDERTDK